MLFSSIEEKDEFMKPVILIQKDNSELLTNSNMMLIKGETGSGKSRLAMNIMKGLITGDDDLNFTYQICPDNKKVVYISTEMSKYHLQRRLLKIIEGVDIKQKEKLVFMDALQFDASQKRKGLDEIFDKLHPHVVIIDQLADFVSDINDLKETGTLINHILYLTGKYDCSVIAIVHQNEGGYSSDKKARGHLGSTLEQKVVSSIAIKESKQIYTISSTKLREGKPITVTAKFNEKTEMLISSDKVKDKYDIFLETITDEISGTDLNSKVMEFFQCVRKSGYNTMSTMVEQGRLEKRIDGKNTWYKVITNN